MGMMGNRGGIGAGVLSGGKVEPALGALRAELATAFDLFGGLNQADARKAAAWAKARPVALAAASLISGDVRVDDFGNLIRWQDYGDHTSQYGWEIDHTQPSALGGTDHHSNLRALHCKTNRSLGGALGNALNRNPFSR